MQRISKKRSGYKAPWSLGDALMWCLRHGDTLDEAFCQLDSLHTDGTIELTGLVAESHPERDEEPQWYRPFGDPATSHRFGTRLLAVIKPGALSELRPVLEAGKPTSNLEYAKYLSPAWREVVLDDRFAARRAWLPLIKLRDEKAAPGEPDVIEEPAHTIPAPAPKPRRGSDQEIRAAMKLYLQHEGGNPNIDRATDFVLIDFPGAGRDRVRDVYREIVGTNPRGRPKKSRP